MGVWYCTREEVRSSQDLVGSARSTAQIDRAIESGSRSVDDLCHRVFYPTDATRYIDWPNYNTAPPWKLYLDKNELAGPATAILSGTVNIPIADVNFEPVNYGPPYTRIELQRNKSDAFGQSGTPQHDVAITGPFGFWLKTVPGGSLAVALNDTTGTSLQASSGAIGSGVDAGDILLIDSERMLVTDRTFVTSGQTQQGSGVSTAKMSDVTLAVTDGTKFAAREILQLDSEQMLILAITGNNLTVQRAYSGTVLATHTGATVYVSRLCTVTRGALGSTAATHTLSTAISKYEIPSLVRELAIAESINFIQQETSGYSRTVGSGDNVRPASGAGLEDLRARVYSRHGRKNRIRAV